MKRQTCLTQHHQQQQQQKQGNPSRRREHPPPKQWPVTSGLLNQRDNYHVSFKTLWFRFKIKIEKHWSHVHSAQLQQCRGFTWANAEQMKRGTCLTQHHNNNRNKATTLGVVSILHRNSGQRPQAFLNERDSYHISFKTIQC
ncbi:unnamed protein product [Polarella glacialis]|uniref:Uncharacterized protein n=1 Tax=Polarella glacialis TaxID=89957 RepID=A0A813J117_POLGL|nr:unnamed protein product [Polarella glacialis]